MREVAIAFEDVWKSYPSYFHISGGIKRVLFNLRATLRDLHCRRTALEKVNFEIYKGEKFGFIGNNGAGKSTTLGLIAGVLAPDQGNIRVNGRVSPLLELGSGFHPELSGRANILLNGVLLGLTQDEVRAHEQKIIEFAELGDFIDIPVRAYSSGMYAKLGFAVVAILKPEILLLDEILAVGDIAFQHKCQKVFEDFKTNPDVTMILVSHSLTSVQMYCDRAAWIQNKTVRMIGPAEEVIKEYQKSNMIQVQVPEVILPHLRAGVDELDCSAGPAEFVPEVLSGTPGTKVQIDLFPQDGSSPIYSWRLEPQLLFLKKENNNFSLNLANGESLPASINDAASEDKLPYGKLDFNMPYILSIRAEYAGSPQEPAVWLPVYANNEAREAFNRQKTMRIEAATGRGFPPHLWPGGKTVRIVARNIMTRDAVGNFAMEVAATLASYGIPVRLYAYASCRELTGVVSPLGELWRQVDPEDIIFYHYSTEDEFLPRISELNCARKVLYYHNVTPGHWFADCMPEFAQALDRTSEQYPLFSAFDAVAANSNFSLSNVLPYLAEDTPTAIYPPTMVPDKLQRITPMPVPLPQDKRVILWVGRVSPNKRPGMAIAVFKQLFSLRDDVALVMVVSGRRDFAHIATRFESDLEKLPSEYRENIILKEGLSDAELAYVYNNASLLLCTSGHEGYCLPVSEALSFGLPVAAFPQPAVEETMAGRGTVLPEDIMEAAKTINSILESAPVVN